MPKAPCVLRVTALPPLRAEGTNPAIVACGLALTRLAYAVPADFGVVKLSKPPPWTPTFPPVKAVLAWAKVIAQASGWNEPSMKRFRRNSSPCRNSSVSISFVRVPSALTRQLNGVPKRL